MINKYMLGRMGNQMFQYAAIRSFQIKNHLDEEKINLDFSYIYKMAKKSNDGWFDSLECLNLAEYGKKKIENTLLQKMFLALYDLIKIVVLLKSKLTRKMDYSITMYKVDQRIQPFYNRWGLFCCRVGYTDFQFYNTKNCNFYGTFESGKYFDNIKNVLLDEFTPKYGPLKQNTDLYKEIENSNSVCVTIRRGDFVSNEKYKESYYLCTPEYFYKAIECIRETVLNPKFFIFSDDVSWVKEHMHLPQNSVFESGEDPVWEKLRLMYCCKHFIISNSTFSWWAQYLSRSNEKVVVAPSRWAKGNNIYKDKLDIYEKDWIIIDN